MSLSHGHVGLKILAKIKIYIISRAKLLLSVWDEIPCISYKRYYATFQCGRYNILLIIFIFWPQKVEKTTPKMWSEILNFFSPIAAKTDQQPFSTSSATHLSTLLSTLYLPFITPLSTLYQPWSIPDVKNKYLFTYLSIFRA